MCASALPPSHKNQSRKATPPSSRRFCQMTVTQVPIQLLLRLHTYTSGSSIYHIHVCLQFPWKEGGGKAFSELSKGRMEEKNTEDGFLRTSLITHCYKCLFHKWDLLSIILLSLASREYAHQGAKGPFCLSHTNFNQRLNNTTLENEPL